MRHTLFISDLHLDEQHPQIAALFQHFMDEYAPQADALYILGDFFEMWLGDDASTPFHQHILRMLQSVSRQGIPIYFLHGNRDFLVGKRFAKQAGMTLLPEIHTVDLYHTKVSLTHGDNLCLLDKKHQQFRKLTQNRFIRQLFLLLPLSVRQKIGQKLRSGSRKHLSTTELAAMDVVPEAVNQLLIQTGSYYLIHGHTHQPKIETCDLANQQAQRIVLGAWEEQGCALVWREDGTHDFMYF